MCTTRLWNSIPRFGLMAFCLLWASAGAGHDLAAGANEAVAAAATAQAAPKTAVADPEPFVSEKGRFRFRFPGKPQESDQKTDSAKGPIIIHATVYVDPKGTNYVVTYLDLDPVGARAKKPETILEEGVKGMVASGGWKVLSKKSIKLGEYTGIDLTGEVSAPGEPETGLGRTRMYLVGARLYQIVLVGGKSNVSLEGFQKYLDSFEVLEPAPEVAEAFISQEGKFLFKFPGKPELSEQKTNSATGPRVIHVAMCVDSKGTTSVVSYVDLDPAAVRAQKPESHLEEGVQGMVKNGGWKVSSKKPIKLGEYPGVDVTGDVSVAGAADSILGRTRLFLVGARLYQVVVLGAKSSTTPADFQKYLESFGVLREAPAVARANPARPAAPAAAPKARQARQQMTKRAGRAGNAVATKIAPRNTKAAEAAIDDDPGPDPSKPAEIAIEVTSGSARLVELPKEADRRRTRGETFRETAPKGGLLVGVRVGYVKGQKVGSVQPIFQAASAYVEGERRGAPVDGETTIVAKPGYAVGGVNARIGLLVDAFQLVFMKYKNGKLDPKDTYVSAWIGDPRGGNLKNVSGNGKIVAGIHGVTNQREVNSLGLVVAE